MKAPKLKHMRIDSEARTETPSGRSLKINNRTAKQAFGSLGTSKIRDSVSNK